MVHTRKKEKYRLDIDLVDKLARDFGWEAIEKKGEDFRFYRKGNLGVKFTKISPFGYKVLHFKNNQMVFSDVSSHKEMGLTLLGEAISFERW